MLTRENYGMDHIQELRSKYKKDPSLLERVLYALGLKERVFKHEPCFDHR